MCGICGFIDQNKNPLVDDAGLRRMCLSLKHRGPDDEGFYLKNGLSHIGLAHRRLSIIDLSPLAHQPMANENGTVWIVFNGEIYNYNELRPELEKKGHALKSHSDTEVVIHLYEQYGEDCVKHLRGMFAFAIWDERNGSLLLARDRVGKKPLFYHCRSGVFTFSSELCSLLESGMVKKNINPSAIDHYLAFGYIPAPLTIYRDVFKLPPAHTLLFKDRIVSLKQYWELDYLRKIKISEQDAASEVMRLLKEAVKIRLYSDVPLGAFLSGGIDSSTIVGLMSQLSDIKVKTFSIGFAEKKYNELDYARRIARRFNTDHHEFIVKPNALEILPLLVERYGEPYAESSCIPTYYVAQETRRYVTVALNGDGGDELFAGYERYQAMVIAEMFQKMPAIFRKAIKGVSGVLPDSVDQKNKLRRLKRFIDAIDLPLQARYLRWVGIFDTPLRVKLYTEEFSQKISLDGPLKLIGKFLDKSGLNLIDSLLRTDTNVYLPDDLLVKVDIASMANSLEGRSPFLDHKLMEFAASLPADYKLKNSVKKYILKKAIKDLIPPENIHRSKMGFGVPVGEWFRGDLKGLLCETLFSKECMRRGYFKPDVIREMVESHLSRQRDYTFCLWSLLMLELWHRRFID